MFLKAHYHTKLQNPAQLMTVAYISVVFTVVMFLLLTGGNKKYRCSL
jgi:hypothetical protein